MTARSTVCETQYTEILTSFVRNYGALILAHRDANEEIRLVHIAQSTIGATHSNFAQCQRKCPCVDAADRRAEAERTGLCEHLDGEAMLTGVQ